MQMAAPGMTMADPVFPPLICGHAADTGAIPVQVALSRALAGELGAGDLVWSRAEHKADFAIVLEPEIDAAGTLAMVPLMMVAVADALGAIGPPNLALTFAWPAAIRANGAGLGGVKMEFPHGTRHDVVPSFAVIGVELAISWPAGAGREPGHMTATTVLHEEGCGDLDRTMIIEACARHFLSWLDAWQAEGFRAVHEHWMLRGPGIGETVRAGVKGREVEGEVIGLDENGGILLRTGKATRLISLADARQLPGDSGESG